MMKRAFLVMILVTGVSLNERHGEMNQKDRGAFTLKMTQKDKRPAPKTNTRSAIQFSRHTLTH
jgi:hypothetical protein